MAKAWMERYRKGGHVKYRTAPERVITDADIIRRLQYRMTQGNLTAARALVCFEHRVPNSGRQWRKLRKRIRRAERITNDGR